MCVLRIDWTKDPETHRSNSSPEFRRLVLEVANLIRSEAHSLINGQVEQVAGVIVAHLAHKHGLAPTQWILLFVGFKP